MNTRYYLNGALAGAGVVFAAAAIANTGMAQPQGLLAKVLQIAFEINVADSQSSFIEHCLSIQALMWVSFGVCAADLIYRDKQTKLQGSFASKSPLPNDPQLLLRSKDLWNFYQKVESEPRSYFNLILKRCAYQFKITSSAEQTNDVLQSSIEIISQDVDLQYSNIRYMVWLIPTLGFIGTVWGILNTLSGIEPEMFENTEQLVSQLMTLGVAFNTTLVSLIMAACLVFALHVTQEKEERLISDLNEYFLDNMINKLYVTNE
ncbi:MAG: MotA/TolQ/ExbB proton channel family protein [Paraglaciecola sp.]|uniref:MotA/TolQ/ExbB proton channel family protein n=1 Tax=Paraglaciecola sp. TaxID=1920173 RepID=UPI003297262B